MPIAEGSDETGFPQVTNRGPLTKKLQDEFYAILGGARPDRYGWLTLVKQPAPQPAGPVAAAR